MAAEDGTQRVFGDDRHLADDLELIVFQSVTDAGIELGHYVERLRRQKFPFIARRYIQELIAGSLYPSLRLSTRPPVRPYSGLTHQLVHGNPDRDGKLEPRTHFSPNPSGDVLGRTEEPAGPGEVEESMAVSLRLDSRREHLEDLVQCA